MYNKCESLFVYWRDLHLAPNSLLGTWITTEPVTIIMRNRDSSSRSSALCTPERVLFFFFFYTNYDNIILDFSNRRSLKVRWRKFQATTRFCGPTRFSKPKIVNSKIVRLLCRFFFSFRVMRRVPTPNNESHYGHKTRFVLVTSLPAARTPPVTRFIAVLNGGHGPNWARLHSLHDRVKVSCRCRGSVTLKKH